jgi:N-acetylneuraminate lyase
VLKSVNFNFPVITGVDTNPLHLLQAIEEVGIPQFRGMKFTDFNTWYYENCLTYRDGLYDICYGRDECLLSGLVLGARGHIGNGFNFAPGVYQRCRAAFAAGDLATARAEQHRANYTVNTINDARFGPHSLSTARLMYELKSKGAVVLGPPRAPFAPLTEAQAAALKAELTASGYFEWCDEVVRKDVPSA